MYIDFTGVSGIYYFLTIERLADNYYREDDAEIFNTGLAFLDKDIILTEGLGDNVGSFSTSVDTSTWDDGYYQLRVHQSGNHEVMDTEIRYIADGNQADPQNNVYFAQIKYVKDSTNLTDDYAVYWFKNDQPLASGQVANPALSVYNTLTGSVLLSNKTLGYVSTNVGVLRYTDTGFSTISGEPYLIEVSGTIDSQVRNWKTIVGLDLY